jgi:DNA ligase-associated metallophosphoesterase
MKTCEIELIGNHFILHPMKAAFWIERDALLVADIHQGKVTHFRKAGLAVPREKMKEDIANLQFLISEFRPQRIFFLGDLFHSDYNREIKLLENLFEKNKNIEYNLILGNHDKPGFLRGIESTVTFHKTLPAGDFLLRHHPGPDDSEKFQICGHLHPAVRLKNRSRQSVKLPCFHVTENMMILPSFGSFTGQEVIRPKRKDRVFVVAGEEVVEVK